MINYICALAGVVAVVIMGLDLFRPRGNKARISVAEDRLFKVALLSFLLLPVGAARTTYEVYISKSLCAEFWLLIAVVFLSVWVAWRSHTARAKQRITMSGNYLATFEPPSRQVWEVDTYRGTLLD